MTVKKIYVDLNLFGHIRNVIIYAFLIINVYEDLINFYSVLNDSAHLFK